MFRQNPGRYEVWRVKDLAGLAALHATPDQIDRMRSARIVPAGEGEIDYRPIFAQAALAGMHTGEVVAAEWDSALALAAPAIARAQDSLTVGRATWSRSCLA